MCANAQCQAPFMRTPKRMLTLVTASIFLSAYDLLMWWWSWGGVRARTRGPGLRLSHLRVPVTSRCCRCGRTSTPSSAQLGAEGSCPFRRQCFPCFWLLKIYCYYYNIIIIELAMGNTDKRLAGKRAARSVSGSTLPIFPLPLAPV